MRGIRFKVLTFALIFSLTLTSCSYKGQNLVCIELWHHYEGEQRIAFDNLVRKFNETEGMNKGIIVEAFSQGTMNDLEVKLANSINRKVGYDDTPDIFAGYPDYVRHLDDVGVIVNIEDYMKKSDINNYIDTYIQEGYIGRNKGLKMIPVGKSTEVLMINKTDWDKFEEATGTRLKELETWEGVAQVAEKYYNWTNSLTPEANDGKAFFARDNLANHILAASQQLGEDMFVVKGEEVDVKIDNDVMKKIWDNYYIPYVNGYYGPFERFAVDDLKTGEIIAYVGSTGEVNYFPSKVTTSDNETYDIEPLILPVPKFRKAKSCAALQGAGMSVLKSDEAHEWAAVEFLKWLSSSSSSIEFTAATGYLPVTKPFSNSDAIEKELKQRDSKDISKIVKMSLPMAAEQIEEGDVYIGQSFNNSLAVRNVLASLLINRAKGDKERIQQLMNEGMTKQRAVEEIATDSNFEQWLVRFKMEVKGVAN